ncbi:TPA: hypothetical protein ACQTYP_001200 [Pseudomonas aeruginosa]
MRKSAPNFAPRYKKGTDDLTDYTPPPEEVLPRLKALSQSIEQRLAR